MNYTSIEQSKRLLELGLKPGTCDKVWVSDKEEEVEFTVDLMDEEDYGKYVYTYPNDMYIPCWSTGALLDLMPPYLFEWERGIDLQIYPHLNKKHGWLVSYIPNNVESMQKDKFRQICHADTLIEAAYNMVVWLLENNYIEKGE